MDHLLEIKTGKAKGIIHYLIFYEVLYHWYRGRLPGFANEKDIIAYLNQSFLNIKLTNEIALEASKIKFDGDKILMKEASLRDRRLSACDATTIALGKIFQIPIISGDKDLKYIAEKLNVKVIW